MRYVKTLSKWSLRALHAVTSLWAVTIILWSFGVLHRQPPMIAAILLVLIWMVIATAHVKIIWDLRLDHDCRSFTVVSRSRDIAVLVCQHSTCYAVWMTAKTPAGEVIWRRTVFEEVKPAKKTTLTEVQL